MGSNEIEKQDINYVQVGIDLLPLLMLLAKTIGEIIKLVKEQKDSVTPEDRAKLKSLIDLTQTIFDKE